MPINVGTRIGPYEIRSPLGEGGMGVVFRAHDTKLSRDVAIKALPAAFATDADHLSRFQREAQVLASLNHSNIAQIYGLESSGGTQCIVMELVEGETLAKRLARGPIPADEALNIAKQIAEALEAAHEKGIIHRDLKPGNVMVLPEGRVKVLDFGLAKALENTPAGSNLSHSPTMSMAATQAGVILGTAAYMSPEQAKGLAADARSDVFAFGCVLYEMLTGRQAFQGETVSEVLASVLVRDPDFNLFPPNLNPKLSNLVRRCLEKNPNRRWHCTADLRMELALSPWETAAAPSARRVRVAWIPATFILAALALLLAIPAVLYFRSAPPASAPEMRVEINTPATTDPISFALSPDGSQIVFVVSGDGASRLWLRSLAATTVQPLAGTEGAVYPFWSPDSRSVGFFAGDKLKRLDIGGGAPQTLATVTSSRGGTWNADGVILFPTATTSALFRIPASGGQAAEVTKLDQQASHRFPSFLPDGRHFLFLARGTPETGGIYLGSLDSAETRLLTAADSQGVYLTSGWLLWVRAGTLVAQRLDLERKALSGNPVTLADPVVFDAASMASALSVSAAGLVAYRTGGANRRQLQWFDRMGKPLGTLGEPDENIASPRVSSDGRRVAVNRTVQGNTDVWILDGTRTSRFTFDPAIDRYTRWSPDGSRILFESNRKGTDNLYMKPSSGAGSEELLLESAEEKTPYDWSADGRFILYESTDPQTGRDLWVLPLAGDRKPWLFLKTNFNERWAQFSPDGRWVAYMSNESGRQEIYVRPFVEPAATTANGTSGQWQVSTAGGIYPRWRPDGKELYYIGPEGQMMAAPVTATNSTLEPGTPVPLFETRIYGGGVDIAQGLQYDVTRDGRFLINTVLNDAYSPITLILNWKPPAK